MIKGNFRTPKLRELRAGLAIWIEGKSFVDTNLSLYDNHEGKVAGPFLIERVCFRTQPEPRVDLIDPASGKRRSFMCSWLLVPKE